MRKYISKHYRDLPTCSIIGSYIANDDGKGNVGQILCRSRLGQFFIFAWGDPNTSYCKSEEHGVIDIKHIDTAAAAIWATEAGLPDDVIKSEILSKETDKH